MPSKNSSKNSISISIADLGIYLKCDQLDLVNKLQDRYQDFNNEDGEYLLSIEVKLIGQDRISPMLDTGTVLTVDGAVFTSPGYDGYINVNNGTGELNLSSKFPVEDTDYFIRTAYSLLVFQAGGVMLHAAGISRGGLGYLFIGHSGSGKTTISKLSSDFLVLNDDLIILQPEGEEWRMFGTPFWNYSQVKPTNKNVMLTAIFCLEQSDYTDLKPISDSKALAEIVANTPVIPGDSLHGGKLLKRLFKIISQIQVQRLLFLPDVSFWNLILEQSR